MSVFVCYSKTSLDATGGVSITQKCLQLRNMYIMYNGDILLS